MSEASGESSDDSSHHFGAAIGRFEILLPIGKGGIANVYLARSRGLGGFERELALKLIHQHLRDEPGAVRDFLEEARIAGRIKHPNVVSVIDVGEDPAGTYLVMDYVEGASLSGLYRAASARGEHVAPGVALRVLVDALSGLHAAHELAGKDGRPMGIVHRDVSPQNILVGLDGIGRLTDFGIAKVALRTSHTRTGMTKGKLPYMAPEQTRADSLDRRADVWSAAVIAWEIVARRRLFKGNEASLVLDVLNKPIPQLEKVVPDVPPELARAVADALKRDLGARTPTAKAFRDALVRGARGPYALADTAEVAVHVERLIGDAIRARRVRIDRAVDVLATTRRMHDPLEPTLPDPPVEPEDPTATPRGSPSVTSTHALPTATHAARRGSLAIGLALVGTLAIGLAMGVMLGRRGAKPPTASAETRVEPVIPSPTPVEVVTKADALGPSLGSSPAPSAPPTSSAKPAKHRPASGRTVPLVKNPY